MARRWEPDAIIAAIRSWTSDHDGHPPKFKDWKHTSDSHPSSATVVNRFGSWNRALVAAGLAPRASPAEPVWGPDAIIAAILAWADEHNGQPPKRRDWNVAGPDHPGGEPVYRVFGSWRAALTAAGFDTPEPPPTRAEGWDQDAILDAIADWVERFGEPPSALDWNPRLCELQGTPERGQTWLDERPRWPHARTAAHQFGTWNEALRQAHELTVQAGMKRSSPRPAVASDDQHIRAWTRDEIADAIVRWIIDHGRPPTAQAWACADTRGQRPSTTTVQRVWGRWSAAISAAVFDLADGRTPEEIANMTGLSPARVQAALARARPARAHGRVRVPSRED